MVVLADGNAHNSSVCPDSVGDVKAEQEIDRVRLPPGAVRSGLGGARYLH